MELYYNPRSALLFVALLQGLIYTVLCCIRAYRLRRVADLALAGFLFLLTSSLVEYCIGFLGIYDLYPAIRFFPFDHPLAYAPCVWVFTQAILVKEQLPMRVWRWFLPAILQALFQLLVFSLPAELKDTYIEQYHFPWVAGVLYLGTFVFSCWVLILCMRLLKQHEHSLSAGFSHISIGSIHWLRYFLTACLVYTFFDCVFTVAGTAARFSFESWWWLYFIRACLLYYLCFAVYQFKEDVALPQLQLAERVSTPSRSVSPQDIALRQVLDQYMAEKKPYLRETLTLQELAQVLDLPANRISFVINHVLGKNFNDWVNEYRVAEVIRHMKDPAKRNQTLLSLSFESGFGSKTTFNRVFKKVTGQAPSEYFQAIRLSKL
jgi:AraC-like DNA-binding protein